MHPLYDEIRKSLNGYYPDSEVTALAKLLLMERFGFSSLELYGGKDKEVFKKDLDVLAEIIERLKRQEPIQYILGVECFGGLSFEVTSDVLIPRPETLELVEWVESDCQKAFKCRVLDIGTGSGCIAVCLAKRLVQAEVDAWDISKAALEVAQRNAARNGVEISFRCVDVLSECIGVCGGFDVIVSNPPYIEEREKNDMERNVLDWEPYGALFVPDGKPLLFYQRIAHLGLEMLVPGGMLYFEINRAYGAETMDMLCSLGYVQVELRKDLDGNDRMIKAVKP